MKFAYFITGFLSAFTDFKIYYMTTVLCLHLSDIYLNTNRVV
jgi:hypothetical protein